jgi:hypothetical protein
VFAHSEFKQRPEIIPYDHDVAIEVDGRSIGLIKTR